MASSEDAYTHAKDFLEGIQLNQEQSSTSKYRDHREKNQKHVVSSLRPFDMPLLLMPFSHIYSLA